MYTVGNQRAYKPPQTAYRRLIGSLSVTNGLYM